MGRGLPDCMNNYLCWGTGRAVRRTCRQGRGQPRLAKEPRRLAGVAGGGSAGDDIVRLTLDGTVVKVRLDRKATAISCCRPRRSGDGQKVVLAIRNMGGESEAAGGGARRPSEASPDPISSCRWRQRLEAALASL